jgi:hypothetical protein
MEKIGHIDQTSMMLVFKASIKQEIICATAITAVNFWRSSFGKSLFKHIAEASTR